MKRLKLSGFRCYSQAEIQFQQAINVFHGDNGAGKTSVLEAIYFISTGKSFRSNRTKNLINHQSEQLTVYAEFADNTGSKQQLGVSLNQQLKKTIRFNHDNINNQSTVAHTLPVVSIDPDSYLFLDKPPQFRRSFLDWLVFHVKPEYLGIWSKVARCQKQLNQLYKDKNTALLPQWEAQYIQYADQLNAMRQAVFNDLQPLIASKIKQFIPELSDMNTVYAQGWSTELCLQDLLDRDRSRHLLYGHLQGGIHKMDLKNQFGTTPAHERLSRGQKKIISIIYYLSFIELMSDALQRSPLLCLDDMDAELDARKTKILADFIQQGGHQVFISTVDQKNLLAVLGNADLFHVKQQGISR
nr:DNA replication and repair protein RecF [Marinicella sp. NBU2979]